MNYDIKGKVALVTGADSGIGRHTARMLLEEAMERLAIADGLPLPRSWNG